MGESCGVGWRGFGQPAWDRWAELAERMPHEGMLEESLQSAPRDASCEQPCVRKVGIVLPEAGKCRIPPVLRAHRVNPKGSDALSKRFPTCSSPV